MNGQNSKTVINIFLIPIFVYAIIGYPLVNETTHHHNNHNMEHQQNCQCGCHGERNKCTCHTAAIGIVGFSYCNSEVNTLIQILPLYTLDSLYGRATDITRGFDKINIPKNEQMKNQDVIKRIEHPPRIFHLL